MNGKFKINATSNDISKIQKVDGSTFYDALELSFNMVDKTSILKTNNVDILESLKLKASASNVYTTQDIYNNCIIYANALNNKADNINTYLKTELDSRLLTSNLLITTLSNSSSVDLGSILRLVKSENNNTFSSERLSLNSASNSMVWMSLFSIKYNADTMHCKLYVDET